MKQLKAVALLGLLLALEGAGAVDAAQQKADAVGKAVTGSSGVQAARTGPGASAVSICAFARSVLEQQGRLTPATTVLPSGEAFAAANGALKLVVACGISSDETYTYSRILAGSGVGLLVFKGNEPRDRVLQQLADRLALSYHLAEPPTSAFQTYVFPAQGRGGKDLRITVSATAVDGGPSSGLSSGNTGLSGGIEELYLLAKANDPELGRSQARVAGSKADIDVARGGFRPHVDALLGISQIDQTVLNYPPTTTHSSVFGFNYDVSARMPLLHLQSFHYLSSAKAGERSEEAGNWAAKQNLIVRLTDAYFSILKAKTDEQIARDELVRLKQVLEQAQAFLKAGTGDIISVYEAQARLDGVLADLTRTENGLLLAEQKLSSIVGKPVSTVADYVHLQPAAPEPDDLEWWLKTMEKQDPQIRQAREGLSQTLEQTKAARAEHYPVIDATAGYDVSRGAAFLPSVETHQWHVGATISVPLYSGGETAARIRRAESYQDERRYVLDAVLEQRRENLKQSFFNLRYSVSLIKALKQKEVSTEIQLNAVKKGRSLGTRTAIDLLNAEQAYSMAKRDLRNALYDNVIRIVQLKAAAGILDEADLSGS